MANKLIRFDEDHFGFLADPPVRSDQAEVLKHRFAALWPGKMLIVMNGDEFIDLTGQYQVVPMDEPGWE